MHVVAATSFSAWLADASAKKVMLWSRWNPSIAVGRHAD
jgi:hypothetical protein